MFPGGGSSRDATLPRAVCVYQSGTRLDRRRSGTGTLCDPRGEERKIRARSVAKYLDPNRYRARPGGRCARERGEYLSRGDSRRGETMYAVITQRNRRCRGIDTDIGTGRVYAGGKLVHLYHSHLSFSALSSLSALFFALILLYYVLKTMLLCALYHK